MPELTMPHSVTYQFEGKASVEDVARSLIAQERLVRAALSVLEGCIDGFSIESSRITLSIVAQESPLKELLAVALVVTFQHDLEGGIGELVHALTGADVPHGYEGLITVLVMIVAIYGVSAFYEKMMRKEPKTLTEERERLVLVAGDYYNVPGDRLMQQLDARLSGARRRSVMKSAVDFFAPAKSNNARAITADLAPAATEIGREAIRAVPSDVDLALVEPETESYMAENVVVKFRRHDLDKNKAWAATIDEISKDRKPLHIDPSINMELLFAKSAVRADVQVTSIRNSEGDYVPSLYYLQGLREHDAKAPPSRYA